MGSWASDVRRAGPVLRRRWTALTQRWTQHELTRWLASAIIAVVASVVLVKVVLRIHFYLQRGNPPDASSFELPRRLLRLGGADGISVFWDTQNERTIRLPNDLIAVTELANEYQQFADVDMSGNLSGTSISSSQVKEFRLAGIAEAPSTDSPGCSNTVRHDRILSFLADSPGGIPQTFLATTSQAPFTAYIFRLPDYALLNAQLLRDGAAGADPGWYPTAAIRAEMTAARQSQARAHKKLPFGC
jgi:hypothetical protein